MDAPQTLPRRGRLYVYGVIAIGITVLCQAVVELPKGPHGYYLDWLILAALTAISGSATVKLPSIPASLSVSETFVFTSVLLFGPAAGTLTVALDGLIISLWLSKTRKEPHRILFNIAAPAISIWVASQIFYSLTGTQPLAYADEALSVEQFAAPLLVFTLLFFGINSWMIAFAIHFETGNSPFKIWRTNFMWLALNFFAGASLAALLAVSIDPHSVNLTYLGAVVPLLLALYLTYRTAMGRVEDAMGHLQRMNKLHLATIETLAHAVDAKDQVTHGHIRRVQNLTTYVATALGVTDEIQLRAIEASALLHDMGKLAIPEHILNKPGKLTSAEFDKMKLHSSIGAEILSSIEFPYPVVPIVRHHHENWDGTGYPDGICGVEIPIGARILSVVDCFDALTSDRPYRPALSTEAALEIVHARRGSMYDPLVVDTFARLQGSLPAMRPDHLEHLSRQIVGAQELARAPELDSRKDRRGPDSLAVLRLLQLFSDVSDASWDDIADLVIHRLGLSIRYDHCVVLLYDQREDTLVVSATSTSNTAQSLRGRKMKKGEGLSGWVAANKRPMINSPASLDLVALDCSVTGPQGTALSVPLIAGERVLGVVSVYRETGSPFSGSDQDVLEAAAAPISALVSKNQAFYNVPKVASESYPTVHDLDSYLRQQALHESGNEAHFLVFQVNGAKDVQDRYSLAMADEAGRQLRGGDVVFVCDNRTIVCLLATSGENTDKGVSSRIASALEILPGLAGLTVATAVLVAPRDGDRLATLLETADRRLIRAVA